MLESPLAIDYMDIGYRFSNVRLFAITLLVRSKLLCMGIIFITFKLTFII